MQTWNIFAEKIEIKAISIKVIILLIVVSKEVCRNGLPLLHLRTIDYI